VDTTSYRPTLSREETQRLGAEATKGKAARTARDISAETARPFEATVPAGGAAGRAVEQQAEAAGRQRPALMGGPPAPTQPLGMPSGPGVPPPTTKLFGAEGAPPSRGFLLTEGEQRGVSPDVMKGTATYQAAAAGGKHMTQQQQEQLKLKYAELAQKSKHNEDYLRYLNSKANRSANERDDDNWQQERANLFDEWNATTKITKDARAYVADLDDRVQQADATITSEEENALNPEKVERADAEKRKLTKEKVDADKKLRDAEREEREYKSALDTFELGNTTYRDAITRAQGKEPKGTGGPNRPRPAKPVPTPAQPGGATGPAARAGQGRAAQIIEQLKVMARNNDADAQAELRGRDIVW